MPGGLSVCRRVSDLVEAAPKANFNISPTSRHRVVDNKDMRTASTIARQIMVIIILLFGANV
jgi:hypothetical protein